MKTPKPGHKFVMSVTNPEDGGRYIVGDRDGEFALIPIDETGLVTGAIAWDSYQDIYNWINAFKARNGKDCWDLIMQLKPQIGEVACKPWSEGLN